MYAYYHSVINALTGIWTSYQYKAQADMSR